MIHNQLVAGIIILLYPINTLKGHKCSSCLFFLPARNQGPNQVAFAQLLEPDAGMILQCCYKQHMLKNNLPSKDLPSLNMFKITLRIYQTLCTASMKSTILGVTSSILGKKRSCGLVQSPYAQAFHFFLSKKLYSGWWFNLPL